MTWCPGSRDPAKNPVCNAIASQEATETMHCHPSVFDPVSQPRCPEKLAETRVIMQGGGTCSDVPPGVLNSVAFTQLSDYKVGVVGVVGRSMIELWATCPYNRTSYITIYVGLTLYCFLSLLLCELVVDAWHLHTYRARKHQHCSVACWRNVINISRRSDQPSVAAKLLYSSQYKVLKYIMHTACYSCTTSLNIPVYL